MTVDVQELRKIASGFQGQFVFQPAHVEDRDVGHIADYVDIDHRLVFVPDGDDEATEVDTSDPDIIRPIAKLLNAVPKLLDWVEHITQGCDSLTEAMLSWMKLYDEAHAEAERLKAELAEMTRMATGHA